MSIETKKFKKHLKELQYQKSELDFVREILKDAHPKFEKYYRDYCEKEQINISELDKNNKERIEEMIPTAMRQDYTDGDVLITKQKVKFKDNTDAKQFKKLYREVAKKCHPDAGGNEVDFKKISNADEGRNWDVLLELCAKYEIQLEDYEELNKILKKQIEKVKGEVKLEKSTYSWCMYDCGENIVCKNNLIKKFLKHLFNYETRK